jgi:hypothetical protein
MEFFRQPVGDFVQETLVYGPHTPDSSMACVGRGREKVKTGKAFGPVCDPLEALSRNRCS